MRTPLAAAAALTVLLSVGLSACTGSDDDKQAGATKTDCRPDGAGTTQRVLLDDKGALPADNWVPVVKATGSYRTLLAALDTATPGLTGQVVTAGSAQGAAVQAAVDQLPRAKGSTPVTLSVPAGDAGAAVGAYYESALQRLGYAPTVEVLGMGPAMTGVRSGAVDVAVVGLSDLAASVEAKVGAGDASAQVQAVAAAAFQAHRLALGATAAATGTPQVAVPDTVEQAASLTTLSELAKACGDATIVAQDGDDQAASAAQTVAKAYGFTVGKDSASAVAVVSAP